MSEDGEATVPFIVVGRSRTGSNLLIDLLQQSPDIQARGEVIKFLHGKPIASAIAEGFRPQGRTTRTRRGFKFFYYHPLDGDPAEAWALLRDIPDLRVIHLVRRDLLATVISRAVLSRTNQSRRLEGSAAAFDSSRGALRPFNIDPQAAVDEGLKTIAWEKQVRQFSWHRDPIEIAYEDLAGDMSMTLRRVAQELDVGVWQAHPRHLRQSNPTDRSSLVSNYVDVLRAFRSSPLRERAPGV
ncbi:MAG: hypothetical protein R2737_14890 [Candidatus Nanopelagicales bacterium]